MPQLIEIEGSLARVISREVVFESQLKDMMPFIENRPPITLPIIPSRTRVVHWDATDTAKQTLELLIELEPSLRTLTMQPDPWGRGAAGGNKTHKVTLPWTLFHFKMFTTNPTSTSWTFEDYRCFFSKERITDLEQDIIPALLPNVFEDGRICFGNTGADAHQTVSDRVDQIVNEWYVSNFNNIGHTRPHYLPWGSATFAKWEKETKRSPFAWKDFPEWDPETPEGRNHHHYQVKDVFKSTLTRTGQIRTEGSIPDLPIIPTFGRAEEWLLALDDNQRFRLRQALANVEADRPEAFVAAAEVVDDEDAAEEPF